MHKKEKIGKNALETGKINFISKLIIPVPQSVQMILLSESFLGGRIDMKAIVSA